MRMLPAHFGCDGNGDLYDSRKAYATVRKNYRYTHGEIKSVADLKATLRNGPYAWPGGYPLYFITSDGGALSFGTVEAEIHNVIDSLRRNSRDGWLVVACDVNWEDSDLVDDHTGEAIESVYAD